MLNILKEKEKVGKKIKESEKEAAELVKDKEAVGKKINEAMEKMKKVNLGPISKLVEDLNLMISVITDWTKGKYKEIPLGSIISILAAIIYFVSPIDLIPDIIPGVGYVDDAFVIGLVLKQVDSDLQAYKIWKNEIA